MPATMMTMTMTMTMMPIADSVAAATETGAR
jgi:hypothetical protein